MESNKPIEILIADDHELFRKGVISLFNGSDEVVFTGEAGDGEELIEKFILIKPDIILADIAMPNLSGTEAVGRLNAGGYGVKALFLSMYEGDEYKYYCYKVGGMGLISKKAHKAELLEAIRTVSSGCRYFGDDWTKEKQYELSTKFEGIVKKTYNQVSYESLSSREKDVLILISEGYTTVQIAQKLFLAKRTIDSYRCNLMKKLKLNSLPELISYAVKNTPDIPC